MVSKCVITQDIVYLAIVTDYAVGNGYNYYCPQQSACREGGWQECTYQCTVCKHVTVTVHVLDIA